MSKRCIRINSTIEELTAKLQGETVESVKGLVELWQDKNNKDWDTYPTASELNNFRVELRKNPHKNHPEWKELERLLPNQAYVVWEAFPHGIDKAPNGADSKLFKDLLEHYEGDRDSAIRAKAKTVTNAFKTWFGDWTVAATDANSVDESVEDSSNEKVSKVVDENGEPLVVYHGSKSKISKFDISFFGKTDGGNSGIGFYFTPEERYAKTYGENVHPSFLNIRTPLITEGDINIEGLLFNSTVEQLKERFNEQLREYKQKFSEKEFIEAQTQVDKLLKQITPDIISRVNNSDGVINKSKGEIFEIVAKRPNQIKSIDNTGEFGETGNIFYKIMESVNKAEKELFNDRSIYNKRFYEKLKTFTDSSSAIKFLLDNGYIQEEYVKLAELLMAHSVKLSISKDFVNNGKLGSYIPGMKKGESSIELTKDTFTKRPDITAEVLLHEVMHHYLGYRYNMDAEFKKRVDMLHKKYTSLATENEKKSFYGLSEGREEFLIEAVTNSELRNWMQRKDKELESSLYNRLKRLIAKTLLLLGVHNANAYNLNDITGAITHMVENISKREAPLSERKYSKSEAVRRFGGLDINHVQNKKDSEGKFNKGFNPTVTKIISGGQTGVDTIGLQIAKELGLETGGTAPKRFLRERGVDNEDISSYGLKEITDEEQADYTKRKSKRDPYTGRTELNVRNSDGTVYFATDTDKSGKIATERSAKEWGKPFILNPSVKQLRQWLIDNNIKTLNVAGNRGSKLSAGNRVAKVLKDALSETSSQEAIEMLDKALSPSFEAPRISTVEEQAKVDLDFDPRTRRDRVSLIARFFSNEIGTALQEHNDTLNKRIADAEKEGDVLVVNELKEELATLDRFKIIKLYTPAGLFSRVRDYFNIYILDSEENRIQSELNTINSMKGSERYSDEQKYEAAKKKALYKTNAYQKVVDNFKPLAEEASTILIATEGIRIDPNYIAPKDANLNNDDPEGESTADEQADDFMKDEAFKDGWMTNYREVSSHESLSQEVRKVIREIPQLDYRGKYDKDDLGNLRFLDADYVHATLIDKLRDMITSDDMLPLLETLGNTKPWTKQIVKKLQAEPKLFSQFYQDFRKDFMPYWIQKKKLQADGTFKMETIAINKPEGIYYLLDEWRDNYENGNLLDDDSIYDKNGDLNLENAENGLKWTEALNNRFINLSTEQRLELLQDEKVWKTLNKLLNMIGINANQGVLLDALTNIKQYEGGTATDPIMLLLPQLNIIFSGVKKGEVKSETLEDGTEKRGDLINTFDSAYNNIAMMLAEVTEDAIEGSVRENDKSYYSHVTPNYLGKLIKQLKNVMGNEARFKEFVENEFGQYEWFYKDGRWRNDWIEQLVNNPEMRRGLGHKVVLNSDKVEYQKWDDLDYTLVLLTEYFGDPDNSKSDIQWANYHVPILSDSPSAEFIRFRKYDNHSIIGEDGEYMKYDDIILDRMVDLVNQEVDRIALVNQRDVEYQKGNPNIAPIANYDIVRGKDGTIKSIGGAEFKFLTALNDVRYDKGETFLDRFQRIQNEGTGSELREFIRESVREALDNEFEQTYREWAKAGLLEELPNGKYKYLGVIGVNAGQSSYNRNTATSLNNAKKALEGMWTTEMDILLRDYNNNNPVDDRRATTLFENIKDLLGEKVVRGEITSKEVDSINRNLVIRNNAKAKLREYFWNSKFATSQIIELTTTDLAFYTNIEDFQKRYKEVHAPALRLNTNSKYGRKEERTIYLKDDEIVSSALDDIATVLDERVKKGEMLKRDRDLILNKFKEVNVADAQAYRSLSSYRAILDMSGQWTDDMQRAFDNFQNGKWDMADFNIIWQTKKPYVYTQVNNMSGVQGHTGIKTPVQHKNSEFLLMAMHQLVSGPLGKSGKLVAINEFMEENGIDVAQFESTTKVGKQGVIDLNSVNTKEDVKSVLKNATTQNGVENPNVVHKVSYEDYGTQTATPEHAIDAVQLVGTQIRKLVTADISPDTIIDVNGKKMTKQEWLDMYNAINTENILQAFADVDEIFKDPKKVEKILLEELRGNQRYGIDMIRACTLNEKGQFNIPLFDPVQSQRVQTLLNSIIKSRITKQKIRGGALIQVSDYGLTDELKIVFEGEGENKRIKYLEVYMPAYSRKFYEPLMKPGTHELDVNKLPDSLRKLIGYRVPTEDKYSMAPLYIKGFLPQQNGSAIMLPAEITTLSGSDFDVDKLYIMLPEFKITPKYNRKQFVDDLIAQLTQGKAMPLEMLKEYRQSVNRAIDEGRKAPKDSQEYNLWQTYKANREKYRVSSEDKIEKIEYDFSKSPQENSLEARNNLLIDMMWGVLTNADTASKILNPGGFDYQKKSARIINILQSSRESELRKELNIPENQSTLSKLQSMDLRQLDKLAERFKKKLDPLNPRTQVHLHQQNMTGAALIGIYANHNANHALMQHTELGLDTENGSFLLNGKRLTSLHGMMNGNKEYISRNNAGFLAASVDNVKDPVLASLNQNTFTADASMLLSRLGYTPIEIGLIMSQPIVMDITNTYFRESREGKGKDTIIDEVIENYKKRAAMMEEVTYDNYKSNKFMADELADNIILQKEVEELGNRNQTSDYRKVEFYKKQVAAGYLFKRIMSTADALGQLVQATRADTQGGAAGPTIADTQIKIQKVDDFLTNVVLNENSPLTGADVILPFALKGMDIDQIREELLSSPLPYLQAFFSLGIDQTQEMFSRYFPQFTSSFKEVIDGKEGLRGLRQYTKTGKLNVKTLNNIYNDLLAYIMSKTSFFGQEANLRADDKVTTSSDKRRDFINNFPDYFNRTLSEHPEIAELEFVKRLRVIKANQNNPVDTIVFKNVGQLSPTLRERYMRDWQSLLYIGPEAQALALNLFRYSYYRNGFAFGPNTFIHLAPTAIRQSIPEYIDTLRGLLESEDDYSQFIDQYIYNHLDNRQLVPEVPTEASASFTNEQGDALDMVKITIDTESNSGDKKIIRKREGTGEETTYDFFNYIARRYKGGTIYYRLTQADNVQPNEAVYERIYPLGFKNSFIEYEYGKDVTEMKSVIEKNDKDYTPNVNQGITAYHEADIDYDSMPEYLNYDFSSLTQDIASEAFSQVYGAPLEVNEGKADDIKSIAPNTEYKDANNDEICNINTLHES